MTGAPALPPPVAEAVAAALGSRRGSDRIRHAEPLRGGCIHPALRVVSERGVTAFLKWSSEAGFGGFAVEARGLQALAARGGLRVPRVLGVGTGADGTYGWLLLEFIDPPAAGVRLRGTALGEGLAHLHRPLAETSPGWDEDGWIGPLPQQNAPPEAGGWPAFWRDRRLLPRWRPLADRFDRATWKRWDRLLDRIEIALAGWEEDGLSLLHGDLWSGNVLSDPTGTPVLIDPAVCRGHREVDLAMLELFGGIPPETLRTVRALAPLAPGYEACRREVYQLHPLLVHATLFEGGYEEGVRRSLERIDGVLG